MLHFHHIQTTNCSSKNFTSELNKDQTSRTPSSFLSYMKKTTKEGAVKQTRTYIKKNKILKRKSKNKTCQNLVIFVWPISLCFNTWNYMQLLFLWNRKKNGRKPIICFKYKTTKTYMGEIYACEGWKIDKLPNTK